MGRVDRLGSRSKCSPAGVNVLVGHGQGERVEVTESREIGRAERSVEQVEVLQMGSVGTSIPGDLDPQPPPTHSHPGQHTSTAKTLKTQSPGALRCGPTRSRCFALCGAVTPVGMHPWSAETPPRRHTHPRWPADIRRSHARVSSGSCHFPSLPVANVRRQPNRSPSDTANDRQFAPQMSPSITSGMGMRHR